MYTGAQSKPLSLNKCKQVASDTVVLKAKTTFLGTFLGKENWVLSTKQWKERTKSGYLTIFSTATD